MIDLDKYAMIFMEKVIEHEVLIIIGLPFYLQDLKYKYGIKLEKKIWSKKNEI